MAKKDIEKLNNITDEYSELITPSDKPKSVEEMISALEKSADALEKQSKKLETASETVKKQTSVKRERKNPLADLDMSLFDKDAVVSDNSLPESGMSFSEEVLAAVENNASSSAESTATAVADTTEPDQQVHYKEMTPGQMVARRFFRSRLSLVGLIMIVALFFFAFAGPPILKIFGYNWGEIEPDNSGAVKRSGDWIEAEVNGEKVSAYQFVYHNVEINSFAGVSSKHFLGTDDKGMDVFVRLMYGGRVSLTLGFVVVILETLIGIILGGISGYFGGWVDQIIMRIVDILNCVPTLPLLLIASMVIESWQIDPQMQIYYLMMIMTLFGWAGTARMVRGQILYLREQEYIVACEVMGIPAWRRILKHLIPNIMPQLIVSMTLGLGSIILYESTLSYLGLGIPMPYAAWGTMISASTDPVTMAFYPNLWIPAGLLIVIAVLGFNFVGDGLRDAMDPKAKR